MVRSVIKSVMGRRFLACGRVAIAATLAVSFVASRANAQSEDQVMAAFLYNFARYVEWPSDAFDRASAPLKICMLGSQEFSSVVAKTVSGKKVGNRPVAVSEASNLEASTSCHILFIGSAVKSLHSEAISFLGDKSVFTVADQAGFASAGGIANFIRVDNRIRFEMNPNAAKTAGLKISSQLLRLAKVVK